MKKSLKLMRKALINLDFLRVPYEFKLYHNERNGTPVGGILSILLGILMIIYFIVSFLK
jgi:hypothetical protein